MALISAIDAAHVHSLYIGRNIHTVDRIEVSQRVGIMMLCFTAPLVIACGHELLYYGLGKCSLLLAATTSCLVIGGLAYVHRVPERWLPGKLDLIGNSHQLMHIFIVLGYFLEGLFMAHMALVKVRTAQLCGEVEQLGGQCGATPHLLSHLAQQYRMAQQF